MLKLYLIRHGETDYNLRGIVQGGGVDSDLNETGRKQGRAFFEVYKDVPFTKIYSSRLKRTSQTIDDFRHLGYEIEKHEGINEFGWGDLEGRPADDETKRMFREITTEWENGNLDVGLPNGETPLIVQERCRRFFDMLFEQELRGNVLICTHGRTLRIILADLLGEGLQNMHLFHHDNTGVNILHVEADKSINALKLNCIEHLEKHNLAVSRVDYRK